MIDRLTPRATPQPTSRPAAPPHVATRTSRIDIRRVIARFCSLAASASSSLTARYPWIGGSSSRVIWSSIRASIPSGAGTACRSTSSNVAKNRS